MRSSMMIIAYEPGSLVGGFGDRVIGLIACKAMAELLGRDFRILWTKENVTPYIDYTAYTLAGSAPPDTITCNSIDRQTRYKEALMRMPEPFPTSRHIKFVLNHEIAQYLYANPRFADRSYMREMFALYKTLYTDILKPTDASLERITAICGPNKNIVGIQIRTGDIYIPNSRGANQYAPIRDVPATVRQILTDIKTHLASNSDTDNTKVFITSDYNGIQELAATIWPRDQLLYNAEPVQHIDRPVRGEFSNFFVDNYILSQRTCRLYISDYSNFGRIAALSAPHEEIYDLQARPLDKISLLSKREQLFKPQAQ
jgi:hypothetical protein